MEWCINVATMSSYLAKVANTLYVSPALGKPHPKKTMYIWALPKLQFDPPYCANPGTLWHKYFAENEKIL